MRRAVAGIWGTPAAEGTPALVVTAVFFALGGLFGCWIAFHSGGGGDEALRAYLEQFLAAASEGQLSVPAWPGIDLEDRSLAPGRVSVCLYGAGTAGGPGALLAPRFFSGLFHCLLRPGLRQGGAECGFFAAGGHGTGVHPGLSAAVGAELFQTPGAWPPALPDRGAESCPITENSFIAPACAPVRCVSASSWSAIWSPFC